MKEKSEREREKVKERERKNEGERARKSERERKEERRRNSMQILSECRRVRRVLVDVAIGERVLDYLARYTLHDRRSVAHTYDYALSPRANS